MATNPPFVAIPYDIFTDPDLSHAAKLVYGRLELYAGHDGRCCPKHETLAHEVCLKERQLRSVLDELRNANLIDWRRTRTSCIYEVFSDRWKTADLNNTESGRKLPISDPRVAENCQSDRQETADLDRQKTADRKAGLKSSIKKQAAAASEIIQTALRQDGISIRDPKHPEEMLGIAMEYKCSAEQLAKFISQTQAARSPRIRNSALMLTVIREHFERWLETSGVSKASPAEARSKRETPISNPTPDMNLSESELEKWTS